MCLRSFLTNARRRDLYEVDELLAGRAGAPEVEDVSPLRVVNLQKKRHLGQQEVKGDCRRAG